jgi:hypothetical protein
MTIGNKITVHFSAFIVSQLPIIFLLVFVWAAMGISTTFLVAGSFQPNIEAYLMKTPEYAANAKDLSSKIAFYAGISLSVFLEAVAFVFVIHSWKRMGYIAGVISGSLSALGMIKNLESGFMVFQDISSFAKVSIIFVLAVAVPIYSINLTELLKDDLDRPIENLQGKSIMQVLKEYIAEEVVKALGIGLGAKTKTNRFRRVIAPTNTNNTSTIQPFTINRKSA